MKRSAIDGRTAGHQIQPEGGDAFARRSCCARWQPGRPGPGAQKDDALLVTFHSEASDVSSIKRSASAIARLAAAQCGMDDGELAAMLMARPVMASTRVFDML